MDKRDLTKEERKYLFSGEFPKEQPTETKIKEWCTKHTCTVDMSKLNLYKILQKPKFHRSMEQNEKDTKLYNRYIKLRAVYYYGKNADNFRTIAENTDRFRRNYFNILWKSEIVRRKSLIASQPATYVDSESVSLSNDSLDDLQLIGSSNSSTENSETFDPSLATFQPIITSTQGKESNGSIEEERCLTK